MGIREFSKPDIAKERIIEVRNAARDLSIKTGGHPAECIFELLCAALLISYEAIPLEPPATIIAKTVPMADVTVTGWFADELKTFRCRRV